MGAKAAAVKFDQINKATIKDRIGHSRTGACTAKGKCYCRKRQVLKFRLRGAKKGKLG